MSSDNQFNILLGLQQANKLLSFLPKAYSFHQVDKDRKRDRVARKIQDVYVQRADFSPPSKRALLQKEDKSQKKQSKQTITLPTQTVEPSNQVKDTAPKQGKAQQRVKMEVLEQTRQTTDSEPDWYPICQRILQKLKVHKSSWPFRLPVEPIKQGVPNYLQIIKQPMDLRTIEKKIKNKEYNHEQQFRFDINKIFLNSYKFNPKDSIYYAHTVDLENYYYTLITELQTPKIQHTPKPINQNQDEFQHSSSRRKDNRSNAKPIRKQKEKEHPGTSEDAKSAKSNELFPQKNRMNIIEREKILSKIFELNSEGLRQILDITLEGQPEGDQTDFEIDIESIELSKLNKIINFLNERVKKAGVN